LKKRKLKDKEIQDINKRFAHMCRYYRSQHKLSTKDLAERLQCSKSMVESYESFADERGPAKSYETILRLSSGFELSPIAFIKILEGKLNEQKQTSELGDEILLRLRKLSTRSVGQLLFVLESKQADEALEIASQLSQKTPSYIKKIKSLIQAPAATIKSLFAVLDTLLNHQGRKK
jgi:transcriptional regulator with XRE-family HTH domain